jgi:hypothetical protein
MLSRTELCFAVGLLAISSATEAASSGGRYSTRELVHPAVRHGWFVGDHCQLGAGISVRFGT